MMTGVDARKRFIYCPDPIDYGIGGYAV